MFKPHAAAYERVRRGVAARKFGAAAGQQLAAALGGVTDPGCPAQVGEWIIECGMAAELFARLEGATTPSTSPAAMRSEIWRMMGRRTPGGT